MAGEGFGVSRKSGVACSETRSDGGVARCACFGEHYVRGVGRRDGFIRALFKRYLDFLF